MAVEGPGHGETIGEVSMDVTANVEHFPKDVEDGVQRSTKGVEPELKKAGDQWGKTLSDNMANRLRKDAPKIGKDFETALDREKVTTTVTVGTKVKVDRDPVVKGIRKAIKDVENELSSSDTSGFTVFGKNVGQAIQDGVGAVFNVSGKSPLILVLIPLFGALAGAILALIQALTALGALAFTLPAILGGLGLSAVALYAAFHGLGSAIQAAFAAKNAKELKAAIKDLTPGAQEFVKNLLPIRDIFSDISKASQNEFFRHAAPAVKAVVDLLKFAGPYITELAITLGIMADKLGGLFSDPKTLAFLSMVANDTSNWLSDFGDAIKKVAEGFRDIAIAAEPFLVNFGVQFNQLLTQFGEFMTTLANDPATQKFFDDMKNSIASIFGLLNAASNFIFTFMHQLNQAGGNQLIDALSDVLNQWTFILNSKFGLEVLKGLVVFGIMAIQVTGGLIDALLILVGVFTITIEFLDMLLGKIGDFLGAVGRRWDEFWDQFGKGLSGVETSAAQAFDNIKTSISNAVGNAVATIRGLPGRAADALGNLGSTLFHKGATLLQGFIDGIASKIPSLADIGRMAVHALADFLPGSPAKKGPLSGSGYSLLRGQRMMAEFARGINMGVPLVAGATNTAVSSVNFGPGAVNANFYGSNPTESQAQTLGAGVGAGIGGMLAAREARAAIRSM
jgi:hypothetical protein